jgi:hypothetical protein
MTNFNKDNFNFDGMYLNYVVDGESKFVARFKTDAAEHKVFANFIRKHFAVEEFFKAVDAGFAPAEVAEARGYVSGFPRRAAKRNGYAATPAGVTKYLAFVYGYTNEQRIAALAAKAEKAVKVEMAIAA